jgi:hypothetical protein
MAPTASKPTTMIALPEPDSAGVLMPELPSGKLAPAIVTVGRNQ